MDMRERVLANTVARCKERGIIIPTYRQMRDPARIPKPICTALKKIGLWDLNPLNLFRITWKNEPVASGGGFGDVNAMELPASLTGVRARILVLLGKYFPTGAHKVGATFGPLVEKLVTGRFDPTQQKALWPSTGNYCRGGAYNSRLLGCAAIAVLPELMSQERFDWLREIGAEVIATPGCESNVKEIYDRCKQLQRERGDSIVNLNQFSEIGNPLWHFGVTGPAMQEVFEGCRNEGDALFGVFLTQGSAGTLGCADYLRQFYPAIKVCAGEALQCPTLLLNGFGGHRIEGIGDKHVPWVHNLRNMDMVAAIDDEATMQLMRLFNEPQGRDYLRGDRRVDETVVDRLDLLGLSGIANMIGCIKMAKYFELDERDVLITVATDSMEMYGSRLKEERGKWGPYDREAAAVACHRYLLGLGTEAMLELSYADKKRMHNLKYFTWVEQQGKTVQELDAQWYDRDYWARQYARLDEWDAAIEAFNESTGLLASLT